MKIAKVTVAFLCLAALAQNAHATNNDENIKKTLKKYTNTDYKIVENRALKANEASLVIIETPTGQRLAGLSSSDGGYFIPLSDGLSLDNSANALKTSLDSINKYKWNYVYYISNIKYIRFIIINALQLMKMSDQPATRTYDTMTT